MNVFHSRLVEANIILWQRNSGMMYKSVFVYVFETKNKGSIYILRARCFVWCSPPSEHPP